MAVTAAPTRAFRRPLTLAVSLVLFGVVAGLLFGLPAIPIDPTVSTGQSVGFFLTRNVFVAGLLVLGGLTLAHSS